MKRAFYDERPAVLEAVGNGSHFYRWDIKEEKVSETMSSGVDNQESSRVQFSCFEVTVWAPVTSNSILQAAIAAKWENDREQKYINEYNATKLGCYGAESSPEAQSKINAYKTFLQEREALKAQIDNDCNKMRIR